MGNDTGFPKHHWTHTPGVPESNTLCLHCSMGPDSDIHLRTTEGSAKPPADRSGCKAWCGRSDQRPGNRDFDGEWQADFRYWDPADGETSKLLVGKPMWCSSAHRDARLPPIAPPVHVERRKGQRWRYEGHGKITDHVLGGPDGDGGWYWEDDWNAGWSARCWDSTDIVMTLVADAPADPSGAGEAGAALPRSRELPCSDGCGTRAEILNQFVGWSCPACTKRRIEVAQEAPKAACQHGRAQEQCDYCRLAAMEPKAAPVCVGQGKPHQGVALERYVKNIGTGYVENRRLCDACHLSHEKEFIELTAPRSTGTPYKGPERLPRPALARDEGVEGDCWPEAGR